MNILKPQKILFDKLENVIDILVEFQKKDEIENVNFEEYKNENIELTDITIRKAIFTNIEITDSNLEKNTFIDIEFKNCNLDYSNFSGCNLKKVKFISCKLNDSAFNEVKWKKLIFDDKMYFIPSPKKHNIWHFDLFEYNDNLYVQYLLTWARLLNIYPYIFSLLFILYF